MCVCVGLYCRWVCVSSSLVEEKLRISRCQTTHTYTNTFQNKSLNFNVFILHINKRCDHRYIIYYLLYYIVYTLYFYNFCKDLFRYFEAINNQFLHLQFGHGSPPANSTSLHTRTHVRHHNICKRASHKYNESLGYGWVRGRWGGRFFDFTTAILLVHVRVRDPNPST